MAKILELQKKDKYNKERTVGSIEIKNQTETTADLCFFGDINSESLGEWQKYYPEDKAPKDVQDFLDQLEGVSKINVHINSGGGSVFGGIAIYNILKRYDAEITVYVEGLAASIASVIAMAGDKIIIPENAQMMIHMIIANMAIVQLLQHQRELENTYFEVGSVEVKSKETYPFNTEKVTVALKDARNTLNYIVLAFCDNLQQGRAIRIKDKQLNGFKIEVEDCPTEPVTIKYFIFGGKI